MSETPFDKIETNLSDFIPPDLLKTVPDKWEKIGDILIIKLSKDLNEYKEKIGEIYADFLSCKTVLNDIGGITGEYRKPDVEIIYGGSDTETIHKENNVRFKLDPRKIMFSSGNMDERIRMANISNSKETIVDLFSGIGYFTLPIAVHSKPKKIFACEKNPEAYEYLRQNIVLNNVTNIVEPLFGDNREIAPKNTADRIIMGYIGKTSNFLGIAFNCLKKNAGIIHFHEKYPEKKVPEIALKNIKNVADSYNRDIKLIQYKEIKSYAPGISHFVFDIGVVKK